MSNYVLTNYHRLKMRHYLLLANQDGYWFNASPNVVKKYLARYGDNFCILLWRDGPDDDAYVLPFERLKLLFTESNLVITRGNSLRWHGGMRNSYLTLRDTKDVLYVADHYNAFNLLQP